MPKRTKIETIFRSLRLAMSEAIRLFTGENTVYSWWTIIIVYSLFIVISILIFRLRHL